MANKNVKDLAFEDYCTGMKYKDIAEKYDINLSTIKSWASRHWKKLQPNTQKVATKEVKKSQSKLIEKTSVDLVNNLREVVCDEHQLTERQQDFCVYYVMSGNALQSYLKAYKCSYATACVEAYVTLEKPRIKNKIKELKEIMRQHTDIDVDDMISFFIKVAKSDIRDYVSFNKNSVKLKDSELIDTSIIQEVKQGKFGTSIKMMDKFKAWEKLEKYFGWDKQEKCNIELSIEEQRLRIEKLKKEIAKDDSQEILMEDDGFTKAIENATKEVWRDD